jgi:Aerobic-type carbon monoxide dehydrogenase, large subunit CoxL/CutL homologs
MIRTESLPYTTLAGDVIDSGNFKEVIKRAVRQMDWVGFEDRKSESESRGLLRGWGLACYVEWTGGELTETVRIQAEAGRDD